MEKYFFFGPQILKQLIWEFPLHIQYNKGKYSSQAHLY